MTPSLSSGRGSGRRSMLTRSWASSQQERNASASMSPTVATTRTLRWQRMLPRDLRRRMEGERGRVAQVGRSRARVNIHPSRLVIFNGNAPPDDEFGSTTYAGSGDSVLLSVVDAIKQADATAANIASPVFEAKVNVIRLPDFMRTSATPSTGQRSSSVTRLPPTQRVSTATSSSTRKRNTRRRQPALPRCPRS